MTFYKLLKQKNSIHLKDNQLGVKISEQSLLMLYIFGCVSSGKLETKLREACSIFIYFSISCDVLTTYEKKTR